MECSRSSPAQLKPGMPGPSLLRAAAAGCSLLALDALESRSRAPIHHFTASTTRPCLALFIVYYTGALDLCFRTVNGCRAESPSFIVFFHACSSRH
mgnify:CR=1 FL=1